jgi:hypothetical protein
VFVCMRMCVYVNLTTGILFRQELRGALRKERGDGRVACRVQGGTVGVTGGAAGWYGAAQCGSGQA